MTLSSARIETHKHKQCHKCKSRVSKGKIQRFDSGTESIEETKPAIQEEMAVHKQEKTAGITVRLLTLISTIRQA